MLRGEQMSHNADNNQQLKSGVEKKSDRGRSSYSSPFLTEYGTVEDLTKGGGGLADDFPGGNSMGA